MTHARSLDVYPAEVLSRVAYGVSRVGSRRAWRAALLVLAAGSLAAGAAGQDRPAPFETLALRVGGTLTVPDDRYGALWQPSPGVEVAAALPFYLGLTVDAGLAFSLHDAQALPDDEGTLPDFLAMHGFGGIGAGVRLPAGARLRGGVHAGILSMDFFEDEAVTAAVRRESELAAGLFADVHLPVTRRLGGYAGVRWTHVYTSTRIDLVSARLGLAWTLATPRWLREVLR